jgi:ATP-binding cassette subfamily B multidrug efflux pump
MFRSSPIAADQIPVGLWAQFRRQSPGYIAGFLFLAVYQGLQYWFDTLLDRAVDRTVAGDGVGARQLGAMLIGIALVAFGARVFSRIAIFNGGRNAEYELRKAVLHHLHKLGPSFYSTTSTGDIMSRVTNDLGQVRLLLGFGVLNCVSTVFALASALAVTLERSVKLTFASLAALPFLVIVVVVFSKKMYVRQRENQDAMGTLSGRVQASIAGIRVVRSFGLEKHEAHQFELANQEYLQRSLLLARLRGVMWPIMQALSSVSVVVLLWYGGHLVLTDPSFDEGAFLAFFRALSRLTWPLISLGFMISVIQRGRASYSRVRELFDIKPDITDGTTPVPSGPLRLEVKDLSFAYPKSDRSVLSHVSFVLEPGKSLAVLGKTGSGKSTLGLLLGRLQNTPRGAVFLNGVDICDVPLAALRSTVGYAQQDPFLFSTTVGRNIGYSLDHPEHPDSLAAIEAAAKEAQIYDEVRALPDGFDTVVGERGVQLSGGQKQRVSLARSLVSRPRILVLDDPLSAVDGRTEAAILDAIERQAAQRSVVLITHRVSAASRCDQVIVLDGGKIAEQGHPATLAKSEGLFAQFAEEQRIERELSQLSDSAPSDPLALGVAR